MMTYYFNKAGEAIACHPAGRRPDWMDTAATAASVMVVDTEEFCARQRLNGEWVDVWCPVYRPGSTTTEA